MEIIGDDTMLAQLKSATLLGLSVHLVEIEVDAAGGLPSWDMVGYRVHTGYTSKKAEPLHGWRGSFCYFLTHLIFSGSSLHI